MLITLKSNNPNLSYLINKNPNSPRITNIRKGFVVAWFSKDGRYCIRFMDDFDEISYPDKYQDFEYLNAKKFSCPLIPINVMDELLKGLDTKYEGDFTYEIEINCLEFKNKTIETLNKYYRGIELVQLKWPTYFNVKLTGSNLESLLNLLYLICLAAALDNDEYMFSSDELVLKYAKKLIQIDAPYFIRYLFKTNMLRNSKSRFEKIEKLINSSETTNYEIGPLNNYEGRIEFCRNFLNNVNVLDYGCGEGRYATRLASSNISYTCFDIDKDVCAYLEKKLKARKTQAQVINDLEDLEEKEYTVLLTEVIEHIEKDGLDDFFINLMKIKNIKKIIITTPNKDFNDHYQVDSRHYDHKFEFTKDEFSNYFTVPPFKISTVDFYDIGDKVNGIPTTLGAVISI